MRYTALIVLLTVAAILSGCTSVDVTFGRSHRDMLGQRIVVVNVDGPDRGVYDSNLLVTGDYSETGGETAASALESQLMAKYGVIERDLLKLFLEKQELKMFDFIDPNTAIEIARRAGLDGIALVRSQFRVVWVFPFTFPCVQTQAKLIDVETGEIVWSANARQMCPSILPIIPFWLSGHKGMGAAIGQKVIEE